MDSRMIPCDVQKEVVIPLTAMNSVTDMLRGGSYEDIQHRSKELGLLLRMRTEWMETFTAH